MIDSNASQASRDYNAVTTILSIKVSGFAYGVLFSGLPLAEELVLSLAVLLEAEFWNSSVVLSDDMLIPGPS